MNRQGKKLTRAGVSYIIKKYADNGTDSGERVTPHIFRHTKAMHLRRAGINMLYIRDFLGHSELSTTEIYAKADTESSREALEQASPEFAPDEAPAWLKDRDLLDWLKSLRK
jgi:site-specific recombinase XerD